MSSNKASNNITKSFFYTDLIKKNKKLSKTKVKELNKKIKQTFEIYQYDKDEIKNIMKVLNKEYKSPKSYFNKLNTLKQNYPVIFKNSRVSNKAISFLTKRSKMEVRQKLQEIAPNFTNIDINNIPEDVKVKIRREAAYYDLENVSFDTVDMEGSDKGWWSRFRTSVESIVPELEELDDWDLQEVINNIIQN